MDIQKNWLQLNLTLYRAKLKTTECRYYVSITELWACWCFDINWKRTLCVLVLKFPRLSTHLLEIQLRIPFWSRFNLSFKPRGKPWSLHLYLIQHLKTFIPALFDHPINKCVPSTQKDSNHVLLILMYVLFLLYLAHNRCLMNFYWVIQHTTYLLLRLNVYIYRQLNISIMTS